MDVYRLKLKREEVEMVEKIDIRVYLCKEIIEKKSKNDCFY